MTTTERPTDAPPESDEDAAKRLEDPPELPPEADDDEDDAPAGPRD